MANQVNTQVLIDGHRNAVVKITGVLDTSNVASTIIIDPANFDLKPTGFRIDHIDYSISDPLEVRLLWDGTPQLDILPIAGRGRMSFWNFGGLQNNAGAGKTGNIYLNAPSDVVISGDLRVNGEITCASLSAKTNINQKNAFVKTLSFLDYEPKIKAIFRTRISMRRKDNLRL